MTNKITLSRELLTAFAKVADSYSDAEDDSFEPWQDAMMHQDLRLTLGQFRKLRAALVEPVPPAGGEVEVRRWFPNWSMEDMFQHAEGEYVAHEDHAHIVTRLQAEVERLKNTRHELSGCVYGLTTELTKARELIGGLLFAFDDGVGRDWSAPLLDEARKLYAAVEFQSAPADKGDDHE